MINFCLITPCYNESKTIGTFIKKIKETDYDYWFVNDGSTDDTLDVLLSYSVPYFSYSGNYGKGHAIKYGVASLYNDCDYFLIMDSDDQHSLLDVPNFIKMAEKYPEVGLFIGNRLSNPIQMPFFRLLANKFMSLVISLMIGRIGAIKDSQCGFRLIKREIFDLPTKENRFAYETEVLIKASKAGYKIKNVPIRCIYNKDRISKISPIKDCIRWVRLLWRI